MGLGQMAIYPSTNSYDLIADWLHFLSMDTFNQSATAL